MLKGLAITPPVLGRISIGKVIEKNGKRLPGEGRSIHHHQPGAKQGRLAAASLDEGLAQGAGWEDPQYSDSAAVQRSGSQLPGGIQFVRSQHRSATVCREWRNVQAPVGGGDQVLAVSITRWLCIGQGWRVQALWTARMWPLAMTIRWAVSSSGPPGSTASGRWLPACSTSRRFPAIAWRVCRWNCGCVASRHGRVTVRRSTSSISRREPA